MIYVSIRKKHEFLVKATALLLSLHSYKSLPLLLLARQWREMACVTRARKVLGDFFLVWCTWRRQTKRPINVFVVYGLNVNNAREWREGWGGCLELESRDVVVNMKKDGRKGLDGYMVWDGG